MTETLDLPVVRAVQIAFLQHEHWLATLGTGGVLGKTQEEAHPFAGFGADSYDVATVLFHGMTGHTWWRQRMYERGLDTMMQISHEEATRLSYEWLPKMPSATPSEVMRTVNMCKRAEKLGLVASNRQYGKLRWSPV